MNSPARHPPEKLFWPIIIFALVFPSLATWVYFITLSGSPIMGPVYTATKILQFSLPIVVVWLFWKCRTPLFNGNRDGLLPGLLFGLATAVAIVGLYLGYLKSSAVFATFDEALTEKLQGLGASTPVRYALLALFISFFHSFLEEYYWRWFVFGQLIKRMAAIPAYAVASIGFAAHHVLVVYAYFGAANWAWILIFSIGVAVGGAVWCWLFNRSRSLLAPWLSHVLVDIALLAVGAMHLWG